MWQRVRWTRVIGIGLVIMVAAFLLLLFLASLGDSDLPPYNPPFPGERLGWAILGIAVWPLVLTARIIGHDPVFILWFPLMFIGGAFWASLIEAVIAFRYARRA